MNRNMHNNVVQSRYTASILETNAVIRNTYILLSMTLLFSAFTAYLGVKFNIGVINPILTICGFLGLFFLVNACKNSAFGILAVFGLTGFMGLTLAPLLNSVLMLSNGSQIISTSFGLTGAIFLGLSGYALMTRKDFSYLGGFLMAGLMVAFVGTLAALFFQVPMLHLGISALFVLISSGLILFDTSRIINGGERNYIMATVALYVDIYNLFVSLVQLLSALTGRNN